VTAETPRDAVEQRSRDTVKVKVTRLKVKVIHQSQGDSSRSMLYLKVKVIRQGQGPG